MAGDSRVYWQALLLQRNGRAFDFQTNIRICKICDRPMQLSDPLRERGPLDLLGHDASCASLSIYASGGAGSASDTEAFWGAFLLPANGNAYDRRTKRRVCIVCDEPVRLDDPQYVQGSSDLIGHDPGCRSLTIFAVGVDDSGGGGGVPITWGSSGITFARGDLTFGSLTT